MAGIKKKRRGGLKTTKQLDKEKDPLDISDKGLRGQWSKFIAEYIKNGGNATRAYRHAYPDVKDDVVAQVNGSRLLLNAMVKEEIQNRLNYQQVTDEWIGDKLIKLYEMHHAGKGAMVAVRAVEILAKIKGLLIDNKRIAFDGENPALVVSKVSVEGEKKYDEMVKKGERIAE